MHDLYSNESLYAVVKQIIESNAQVLINRTFWFLIWTAADKFPFIIKFLSGQDCTYFGDLLGDCSWLIPFQFFIFLFLLYTSHFVTGLHSFIFFNIFISDKMFCLFCRTLSNRLWMSIWPFNILEISFHTGSFFDLSDPLSLKILVFVNDLAA